MTKENTGFSMLDWANAKGADYELTEDNLNELQALLAPAVARMDELNIPYVLCFQGALSNNGMQMSLNGSSGLSDDPSRLSPNMMLFQILMMDRNIGPDEAVAIVSQAAQMRLANEGPEIIV